MASLTEGSALARNGSISSNLRVLALLLVAAGTGTACDDPRESHVTLRDGIHTKEKGSIDQLTKLPNWFNTPSVPTASTFANKLVLVDFFGSYCGPCIAKIPELNRLQDEFGRSGLVVVGVSDESPRAIRNVTSRMNYLAAADAVGLWKLHKINAVPTVILVNGTSGDTLFSAVAPSSSALRAAITDALASEHFKSAPEILFKKGSTTGSAGDPSRDEVLLDKLVLSINRDPANASTEDIATLLRVYRANLGSRDNSSLDREVRLRAVLALGVLERLGKPPVSQQAWAQLLGLLKEHDPASQVRQAIANQVASKQRRTDAPEDRRAIAGQLAQLAIDQEADIHIKATLQLALARFDGRLPHFKEEYPPSNYFEIRAAAAESNRSPNRQIVALVRALTADATVSSAFAQEKVDQILERLHQSPVQPAESPSGIRALQLRVDLISILDELSGEEIPPAAQGELARLFAHLVIEDGPQDWGLQSILLQRLDRFGVKRVVATSEADFRLKLLQAVKEAENKPHLAYFARVVRLQLEDLELEGA
jgi:thiol-disulfide isomerase/thioredoxin